VLLALARMGHGAAPLLGRLAELAAGADQPAGAPALADLLAPCDARRLLSLIAEALEEEPQGPEGALA
jgi:hypothetical protein